MKISPHGHDSALPGRVCSCDAAPTICSCGCIGCEFRKLDALCRKAFGPLQGVVQAVARFGARFVRCA